MGQTVWLSLYGLRGMSSPIVQHPPILASQEQLALRGYVAIVDRLSWGMDGKRKGEVRIMGARRDNAARTTNTTGYTIQSCTSIYNLLSFQNTLLYENILRRFEHTDI